MKKTILIIITALWSVLLNAQTTYYVDQTNGNDSNNGNSTSTAFKSMNEAVSNVTPGDTILIIGEYKNNSYNSSFSYINEHDPHLWHAENSILINNLHGTSGNFITIKAFDSSTILKGDGANIFRIQNSSYLRIGDFNIEGEVQRIPLSTANALQFVYIDADNTVDPNNPTSSEIIVRLHTKVEYFQVNLVNSFYIS